MSRFDQTGPMGMGPGTGRGMGMCMGFGGFKRRGLGGFFSPWRTVSREEKLKELEAYKTALTEELEDVEAALKTPDTI